MEHAGEQRKIFSSVRRYRKKIRLELEMMTGED